MSRLIRVSSVVLVTALAAITMAGAAHPAAPAGRSAALVFPRLQSRYVRMPDGVRLAVDVWLPPGTTAGARLPTVLESRPVLARPGVHRRVQEQPELLHRAAVERARVRVRVR